LSALHIQGKNKDISATETGIMRVCGKIMQFETKIMRIPVGIMQIELGIMQITKQQPFYNE
jgi:hypothetical protein